jgi:hypothetical protein
MKEVRMHEENSLPGWGEIEWLQIGDLKPHQRNPRTHTKKQIRQIANSITRFGFTNPVLADEQGRIIAGHGRVEAARLLKMEQVPVRRTADLSEADRRAYIIADNRLAELALTTPSRSDRRKTNIARGSRAPKIPPRVAGAKNDSPYKPSCPVWRR